MNMSTFTDCVNFPLPDTLVSLTADSMSLVGCSVMMFITPPIASLPYREDAAPSRTSMRFTLDMLIRLMSMLLDMSPLSFRPFTSIRMYLLPSPLSLNCEPMALGASDICGIIRVTASSNVDTPCSRMSLADITVTGVTADLRR